MQHEPAVKNTDASKGFERGYGSVPLDEGFAGDVRCPATDSGRQCSATLAFQIKSLGELRESRGEIEILKCANPNGLDDHCVIIFTGKRDGQEFPFVQATHMCPR